MKGFYVLFVVCVLTLSGCCSFGTENFCAMRMLKPVPPEPPQIILPPQGPAFPRE